MNLRALQKLLIVTSRTLLENEGLRHPVKFFRGLSELGCDAFMRQ